MNVLSLFDGISCGQIALNRAGIKYDKYFASEIDKNAIKVTQHNYPNTVQLGDITKWREWNIEWHKIELLTAGFPCQAWSLCGKQEGLNDPRGALALVLFDIFTFLREKNSNAYFLFENVKMKKPNEEFLNNLFGAKPLRINSSLLSAQQRNRLYWTNIKGVIQPEDKGIFLKDILEFPELVEVDREKSLSLNASYKSVPWKHYKEKRVNQMLLYRLSHGYITEDYYFVEKYPALCTQSPGTKHKLICNQHYRTLTPVECERLQTIPDNYTNSIAKTNRYKAIGNGWTVDVIAHILRNINQTP